MEHACKMLLMSVGLIMTCSLIGFGMITFRQSRMLGYEVQSSLEEWNRAYAEYEWMQYDHACVSGAEVVNVIRKYQKELPVTVEQVQKRTVYEGQFLLADNKPGEEGYIRFADTYRGEVLRDEKDQLSGMVFRLVTE